MLEVEDLFVQYGSVQAVRGISIQVGEGELVSLVGPNAAGKSSTVRAISGQLTPASGSIRFDGKSISGMSSELVVRRRLATVPEDRGMLTSLTVHENLLLAASVAYSRAERRKAIQDLADRFPAIGKHRNTLAGSLSGGEQQQIAIARALLLRPRLLMLDEPSLGLSPTLVTLVFQLIDELRQSGVTILLVEQEAHRAARISDRCYVMVQGQVRDEGDGDHFGPGYDFTGAYLGIIN